MCGMYGAGKGAPASFAGTTKAMDIIHAIYKRDAHIIANTPAHTPFHTHIEIACYLDMDFSASSTRRET